MMKRFRSLWTINLIVALAMFIVVVIAGYWFQWGWTGFPAKTLWDWLGVLAIPLVVSFGVAWYTAKQTQAKDAENEQQRKTELEIANQRHKTELEIAADNQRETALQAYIDKMSELLLANDLRNSLQAEDEVRKIARVRTLTVLRRLDSSRKASLLQFLYEAGLINKDKPVINLASADLSSALLSHVSLEMVKLDKINLAGANLSESALPEADLHKAKLPLVNLAGAYLRGADLSIADLRTANLVGADLRETDIAEADLRNANLAGANFTGANLSGADLSGAKGVTNEQLSKAKLLKGVTMPDGSKHP